MKGATKNDAVTTITTHYIDAAFVEFHGREVLETRAILEAWGEQ